MSIYCCEMMESWCADERVPVEFSNESGKFTLIVNAETVLALACCPFCGKSLDHSGGRGSAASNLCGHLAELSTKTNSSIKYSPECAEYLIAGSSNLQVSLLFCPICGRQLPRGEKRHHEKSPSEVGSLKTMFANAKSVDQVIELAGPPDFERGPALDHFYWKGERVHAGYRRFLYYERLAKTVNVHVIEQLDGRIDVKFLAKPLEPG